MNQVKIEVSIDVNDLRQVEALNSFLTAIGSEGTTSKKETPKQETTKKVETPKPEAAKKVETPKPEVEKPKVEEKEEAPETESEIKIEDVRALLAKKVQDNRTEIKSFLTALEANNVTSLDKSKYPKFMDFLNGLK